MMRLVPSLMLLGAVSMGCDGAGCGDVMAPLQNPIPDNLQFDRAAEVVVSESGMEAVENALPTIVSSFGAAACADLPCPDGSGPREDVASCNADGLCVADNPAHALLGFEIPPNTDSLDICSPDDGDITDESCAAWVVVKKVNLYEANGGDLRADIDLRAWTSDIVATGWCYAELPPTDFTVVVDLSFDNDNPLNRLRISYSEIDIPIGADDLNIDGGFGCGVANALLGLASGLVDDLLKDTLTETIDETLASFLNESCAEDPCTRPDVSYCDADDVCRFTSDDTTVPTLLGLEGTVDLESLLGSFAGGAEGVDFTTYANHAEANGNALNLRLRAGMNANHSDCVPSVVAPSTDVPVYLLDQTTPGGSAYHAAIGASKNLFDSLLYNAFDGGALCQSMTGADIPQLSSGALSLLMPSLNDVTGGESVPLAIDIRPRGMPEMQIGRNTTSTDGDGAVVLEEPLLNLVVNDLDLDIYAEIGPGLLRLLTLRADLVIDMALVPNEEGALQLVTGDAANWIRDVEILNSGLLREDPDEIAAAVPALVGAFLPTLTEALADQSFALPPVSGFVIDVHEITGTGRLPDPSVGGHDQFHHMSIFADLAFDPNAAEARTLAPLRTSAAVAAVTLPSVEELRAGQPVVVDVSVDADGLPAGETPMVWHRVDHGAWRPLAHTKHLVVKDSQLAFEGKHSIVVRTARPGLPHTLDVEGVTLEMWSDFTPPVVTLDADGASVIVQVRDSVTPHDRMQAFYAVDGMARGRLALDAQGRARLGVDPALHEVHVWAVDLGLHRVDAIMGTMLHDVIDAKTEFSTARTSLHTPARQRMATRFDVSSAKTTFDDDLDTDFIYEDCAYADCGCIDCDDGPTASCAQSTPASNGMWAVVLGALLLWRRRRR